MGCPWKGEPGGEHSLSQGPETGPGLVRRWCGLGRAIQGVSRKWGGSGGGVRVTQCLWLQ